MATDQQLRRALALHQAGQLADAAELYRDILKSDPTSVDAWNLLSALFVTTRTFEAAILSAQQAIALQPQYFAPYLNLGNALQASGKLDEAIEAFEKAVELAPESPDAHNNLASAFSAAGRYADALVACKVALAYRSDFVEALNNRGNAEAGLGMMAEAVASYRMALARKPDYADALYNLGGALSQIGEIEDALGCYRMAIGLDPDSPEKHFNLGHALLAAGRVSEAEASFHAALRLRPGYVDALNNLGSTVQALGRLDEAESLFRQALAEDAGSADVHWNLALVLLQKGDYEAGWREYEWRWRNPAFTSPPRSFASPQWAGESLDHKTILLHAEQGFGDSIQFARYVSMVAKTAGAVILECRPPLRPLFETVAGAATVIGRGEALPPFDFHMPLMSLPLVFGTRIETVPVQVPYLSAPPGKGVDPRIAASRGLKIGFAWSGSRTRRDNRLRSASPAAFAALFDIPGATFFSLQVDDPDGELQPLLGEHVVDLAPGLQDFGDSAAAVAAMDLVITVDTALAHLAGAMAKPVWVLLAFAPGYLWMLERADSPWYPTARLFRQPAWGDWNSVFIEVKEALRDRAERA